MNGAMYDARMRALTQRYVLFTLFLVFFYEDLLMLINSKTYLYKSSFSNKVTFSIPGG